MELEPFFGMTASVVGLLTVLAWRVRESRHPISTRGIVIPPIAMSTGFAMFAVPAARVPLAWAFGALLLGALLLSIPVRRTSRLERAGDLIVLRRSRAFVAIIAVLAGLRLALRGYLDDLITPLQTGALLYLLAFGMIVCWRAGMLAEYRRLLRAPAAG